MDLSRLALGIHDLIPVLVAAAGLAAVAAAVQSTQPRGFRAAVLGATFIVLGGLSKASAKLIGAITTSTPPQLLDDALFPLLAPGMLLLAGAVVGVLRAEGRRQLGVVSAALVPLAVWSIAGAAAVLSSSAAAKALLIGLATLGNVVLALGLITWARRLELGRAVLFAVNLIIVVGLAGMARALEQTTASQWIEQNVNLVGQLAFLFASHTLWRAVRSRRGKEGPEQRLRRETQP